MTDSRLPTELLWAEGHHASDIALMALADGQLDIVPEDVRAHVEGCASCSRQLGHAALLSLHVARELTLEAAERPEPARAKVPWGAVLSGLAVAALGLVPTIWSPDGDPALGLSVKRFVLLATGFGGVAKKVFAPGNAVGLALTYGASALLVVLALAVIRLLPKKEVSS